MSIFAAILLASAQSAAAAPNPEKVDPRVAAQVPVIARKLQDWRGTWGAVDGSLACRTLKSTGDDRIDMIGCAATLACVKPQYPALKAIADGSASVEEKKRLIGEKLAGLQPCMAEHRGNGIAALAMERGMGGNSGGNAGAKGGA